MSPLNSSQQRKPFPLLVPVSLLSFVLLSVPSSAGSLSSQTYTIQHQVLDAGGGRLVSEAYVVDSSIGVGGSILKSAFVTVRVGFAGQLHLVPLAVDDTVERRSGGATKVNENVLLENDAAPDGGALVIEAVSAESKLGGEVFAEEGWVFYLPPEDFDNADSFTYTIRDSRGEIATAVVAVQDESSTDGQTQNRLRLGTVEGTDHVRVIFVGIPGQTYRIEAAEDIENPDWITLATQVAGPNGLHEYTDTEAGNFSVRFYRAVQE